MGKTTNEGWSTSSDEILQPNSVLTGPNLRKPSAPTSSAPEAAIRSGFPPGLIGRMIDSRFPVEALVAARLSLGRQQEAMMKGVSTIRAEFVITSAGRQARLLPAYCKG
jgi:hypothetical protein